MLRAVGIVPSAAQQALRQAASCTALFSSAPPDYGLVLRQAEAIAKDVELAPPGEVAATYGVPAETFQRKVLIHCPARSAGQQGWGNSVENVHGQVWKMEFNSTPKWINPLMGWTSTADPLENVGRASLLFRSAEEAVAFAAKSGWAYEVAEPQPKLLSRPKRFNQYGDNFSVRRKGFPDLSTMPSNNGAGTPTKAAKTAAAASK